MTSRGTRLDALAWLALVAVISVSGCGSSAPSDDTSDDGAESSSSSPSDTPSDTSSSTSSTSIAPPSTSSDLVDEEGAKKALRAAVREIASEPVTVFDADTALFGETVVSALGTVAPSGADTQVIFTVPGEPPSVMYVRADGRHVWMQMRDWKSPMTGCWLDLGLTGAPVGMQALAGREPAFLSVLGSLRPRGFVAGFSRWVVASMPIQYAGALLPVQVIGELDLTRVSPDDRVDVLLNVHERVESLQLAGQDFLDAMEAAGGLASDKARLALAAYEITVAYPFPPTSAPPMQIPDPALVVTENQMSQGC